MKVDLGNTDAAVWQVRYFTATNETWLRRAVLALFKERTLTGVDGQWAEFLAGAIGRGETLLPVDLKAARSLAFRYAPLLVDVAFRKAMEGMGPEPDDEAAYMREMERRAELGFYQHHGWGNHDW